MATNTRTKTNANAPQDPASLLAAALQAMAASQPGKRVTARTHSETLAQPLTARDRAALERMGWTARLSSAKPSQSAPSKRGKADARSGPRVTVGTFADLSPERQASTQFWAGLCSTLSRSNGKIWIPEVAAVAAQLQVEIDSPAVLANRLAYITHCAVSRPADQAGWLVCELPGEMPAANVWAQLWNAHLTAFGDAIAAEGIAD
jgi:hypothetical protein